MRHSRSDRSGLARFCACRPRYHRVARARRAGYARSRRGAALPRAPRGDRSRGRAPADGLARRAPRNRVQRRDLQLPGAARGTRARRVRVRDPIRHRGAAARLRGMGSVVAWAPGRHVRFRGLGLARAAPVRGARSHRHQAVLLCRHARRLRVRLDAGAVLRAAGISAPRGRGGAARLSRLPDGARAAQRPGRRAPASSRELLAAGCRRAAADAAQVLGDSAAGDGARGCRGAGRPRRCGAPGIGAAPVDCRRALGRVSLGRHG